MSLAEYDLERCQSRYETFETHLSGEPRNVLSALPRKLTIWALLCSFLRSQILSFINTQAEVASNLMKTEKETRRAKIS